MEKFKGTKGKWVYEIPKESNGWIYVLEESTEEEICTLYNGQVKDEYGNAILGESAGFCKSNALLISKAPEMLEMLKRLIIQIENEHISEYLEEIKIEAKQLINEATNLNQ